MTKEQKRAADALMRTLREDGGHAEMIRKVAPPVPPGVHTFDPRRFRRHDRARQMREVNRKLAESLKIERESREALSDVVSRSNQRIREMQTVKGILKIAWRKMQFWRGGSR